MSGSDQYSRSETVSVLSAQRVPSQDIELKNGRTLQYDSARSALTNLEQRAGIYDDMTKKRWFRFSRQSHKQFNTEMRRFITSLDGIKIDVKTYVDNEYKKAIAADNKGRGNDYQTILTDLRNKLVAYKSLFLKLDGFISEQLGKNVKKVKKYPLRKFFAWLFRNKKKGLSDCYTIYKETQNWWWYGRAYSFPRNKRILDVAPSYVNSLKEEPPEIDCNYEQYLQEEIAFINYARELRREERIEQLATTHQEELNGAKKIHQENIKGLNESHQKNLEVIHNGYQAEIADLKKTHHSKMEITTAEYEKTITEHKSSIKVLQDELATLKLGHADKLLTVASDTDTLRREKDEEIASLKEKLENKTRKVETLSAELEATKKTCEELDIKLEEAQQKEKDIGDAAKAISTDANAKQEANAELQQTNEDLMVELGTCKEQLVEARARIETLQRTCNEQAELIAQLEKHIEKNTAKDGRNTGDAGTPRQKPKKKGAKSKRGMFGLFGGKKRPNDSSDVTLETTTADSCSGDLSATADSRSDEGRMGANTAFFVPAKTPARSPVNLLTEPLRGDEEDTKAELQAPLIPSRSPSPSSSSGGSVI